MKHAPCPKCHKDNAQLKVNTVSPARSFCVVCPDCGFSGPSEVTADRADWYWENGDKPYQFR